ncbi:MAG: hypothetical protein ABIJ72_04250 [bacterium]
MVRTKLRPSISCAKQNYREAIRIDPRSGLHPIEDDRIKIKENVPPSKEGGTIVAARATRRAVICAKKH